MADPKEAARSIAGGISEILQWANEESSDTRNDALSDGYNDLSEGIEEALRYLREGE